MPIGRYLITDSCVFREFLNGVEGDHGIALDAEDKASTVGLVPHGICARITPFELRSQVLANQFGR